MLYLQFRLDRDRYAIAAREVLAVLPLVAWKQLPGAPRGIAGLFNYGGAAVPLLDLAALVLDRPSVARVSTRILLVRVPVAPGATREIGVIVEHATETLSKRDEEFRPAGVGGGTLRFLGPVTVAGDGLVQRLEVNQLLTAELGAALAAEVPA